MAEESDERGVGERRLEEGVVEERIYTIPLARAWISPVKRRAPRAMRIIRSFMDRHMKPETLVISKEVNEKVWSRGIEKPPRRIRVRATKDREGVVTVYLA
ncbi:MAG: 50S ribosomal protein L31e [Candidatus Bathyarchaeia archaeon]